MASGTLREGDLYPLVEAWLTAQGHCFHAEVKVPTRHGRVDVAGLRDVGRDLSSATEVVAIEVKGSTARFAASAGQARGYAVFAERVYLAVRCGEGETLTHEQISVASALGVGLLAVRPRGRPRVREVLTSPIHTPVVDLRLQLLERMSYGVCTICDSIFPLGDETNRFANLIRLTSDKRLIEAVRGERGVMYWLDGMDERDNGDRQLSFNRRYVCPDCVGNLFWHLART